MFNNYDAIGGQNVSDLPLARPRTPRFRGVRGVIPPAALVSLVCLLCCSTSSADELVRLKLDEGDTPRRVDVRLRATGSLKVAPQDPQRHVPISVRGTLQFVEVNRPSEGEESAASRQVVRQYLTARAEIEVDEQRDETALSATRRLISVEDRGSGLLVFSALGPLTRNDVELLQTQFDPILLPRLLPAKRVAQNQSWRPDASTLAALLGLDAVTDSQVECSLGQLDADSAKIHVAGNLEGVAGGAKSNVELSGQLTLDRRRGRLTGVTMEIAEQRGICPTAPGFEMSATLTVNIRPDERPAALAPQRLARLSLASTTANTAVDFLSPSNGFGLIHDRRWHVTTHRQRLVVLRLVDLGELLGQCNISKLPLAEGDSALELAKFRAQVEAALGEHFGRIEEASRATTESGMEILRIEAAGNVKEVPVTWIYYYLRQRDGRRAALVFTLQTDHYERFGGADHQLVANFRFLERTDQAERTESTGTIR